MLDYASPPESLGGAAMVEARTSLAAAMPGDEVSHVQAQLEAAQEVTARSVWEAAAVEA